MSTRQTEQEAHGQIFQDEEANSDLEEDVSEQEDNMEGNSDYSRFDEDIYIGKQYNQSVLTSTSSCRQDVSGKCHLSDSVLTVRMVIHGYILNPNSYRMVLPCSLSIKYIQIIMAVHPNPVHEIVWKRWV